MALPQLMSKIWTGQKGEFFSYRDMGRVESNVNFCAREAGLGQEAFLRVEHKSSFRYDEVQKLEDFIASVGASQGLDLQMETAWGYGRTISYMDFERWESGIWAIYKALGGEGERIPADKIVVNYRTTLFPTQWKGAGPYETVVEFPDITEDSELMAFVTHTAALDQRVSEYNAVLRTEPYGDGAIRFRALSILPKTSIPVTVAIGGLQMRHTLDLPASRWVGKGPWTQTVTVPPSIKEAVIGQWEGMSDEAVEQMMDGMLHVSMVKGSQITIRAMGAKPTIDLNPALLYDTQNAEAA